MINYDDNTFPCTNNSTSLVKLDIKLKNSNRIF